MTYLEKLRDPRWQKKRLEVFQRDKWKCTECSSKHNNLQVHHKRYYLEPWDAKFEDLTTLCDECHLLETSLAKDNPQIKLYASKSGVTCISLWMSMIGFSFLRKHHTDKYNEVFTILKHHSKIDDNLWRKWMSNG